VCSDPGAGKTALLDHLAAGDSSLTNRPTRCGKRPGRSLPARNWWCWPSARASTPTAGRCCAACARAASRAGRWSSAHPRI